MAYLSLLLFTSLDAFYGSFKVLQQFWEMKFIFFALFSWKWIKKRDLNNWVFCGKVGRWRGRMEKGGVRKYNKWLLNASLFWHFNWIHYALIPASPTAAVSVSPNVSQQNNIFLSSLLPSRANRIKFLFNFLSLFSPSHWKHEAKLWKMELIAAFNLILLLCDFYV